MATRADVINKALEKAGLTPLGEAADADQAAYAGELLDDAWEELQDVHGVAVAWDLTAVPAGALVPLANLVAVDISPRFNRPAERRATALVRLLAILVPNDAEDRRDTDEDGTITDAEADAGLRTAYY